jgi:hypothetical protein
MQESKHCLPKFLTSKGLEVVFTPSPVWFNGRSDPELRGICQGMDTIFKRRLGDVYTIASKDDTCISVRRAMIDLDSKINSPEDLRVSRIDLAYKKREASANLWWVYVRLYRKLPSGEMEHSLDDFVSAMRDYRELDPEESSRCISVCDVLMSPFAPMSTYIRLGYTKALKAP